MTQIEGKIRSTASKNGKARWEITINGEFMDSVPYEDGKAVPIVLELGSEQWSAKLRSTTTMRQKYNRVWISESVRSAYGGSMNLADILVGDGFTKNQTIRLQIDEAIIRLVHG